MFACTGDEGLPGARPELDDLDDAASAERDGFSFDEHSDASTWQTVTRAVNLAPGTYHIRATATGANGSNIDRLEVA